MDSSTQESKHEDQGSVPHTYFDCIDCTAEHVEPVSVTVYPTPSLTFDESYVAHMMVQVKYEDVTLQIDTWVGQTTGAELLKSCRLMLDQRVANIFLRLFVDGNPVELLSPLPRDATVFQLVGDSLSLCPSRPSLGPWNLFLRQNKGVFKRGRRHIEVKVWLRYDDFVANEVEKLLPVPGMSVLVQSYLLTDLECPRCSLWLIVEPVDRPQDRREFELNSSSHSVSPYELFRNDKSSVFRCIKIRQVRGSATRIPETIFKFASELSSDNQGTLLRSFANAVRGWLQRLFVMPAECEQPPKSSKRKDVYLDWIEVVESTSLGGQPAVNDHILHILCLGDNIHHDQVFKVGTSIYGGVLDHVEFAPVVDVPKWQEQQRMFITIPNRRRFELLRAWVDNKHPLPFDIAFQLKQLSIASLLSFTLTVTANLTFMPRRSYVLLFICLPKTWSLRRLVPGKKHVSAQSIARGEVEWKGVGRCAFFPTTHCLGWKISAKDVRKQSVNSMTFTIASSGIQSTDQLVVVASSYLQQYYTFGSVSFFKEVVSSGPIAPWVRYETYVRSFLEFPLGRSSEDD